MSLNIKYAVISIPVAYLLWFVTFYIKPSNFWLDISLSSLVLFSISLYSKPPLRNISPLYIFVSILSAIFLYLLFYFANNLSYLIPVANKNIQFIYGLAVGVNPLLLLLILIFPIASGEEFFWRGLVQRAFSERYGAFAGYLISVFGDTTVHLSSLNPILVLSAFITSIVWGYLFLYTKSLTVSLISHVLWDILVFVLFPIR